MSVPAASTMDITAGMTHESIGDAIKDGLGESHSEFWKQGPSAFVEGFVELIQALRPATIHVPAATDKDGHEEPGGEAYDLEIGDTLPTLLDLMSLDGRRLDAVFEYGFSRARSSLEHETGRGLQVARVCCAKSKSASSRSCGATPSSGKNSVNRLFRSSSPLDAGRYAMRSAIATASTSRPIEKGHVILVEIDESEYPRAVSTVVRMVFRRIVQMARERTASHRVGNLDPILLICDEYANYAAAGHVQAWNTIRESNFCRDGRHHEHQCPGQQLGDQHAANAIVANFANKFFFESTTKRRVTSRTNSSARRPCSAAGRAKALKDARNVGYCLQSPAAARISPRGTTRTSPRANIAKMHSTAHLANSARRKGVRNGDRLHSHGRRHDDRRRHARRPRSDRSTRHSYQTLRSSLGCATHVAQPSNDSTIRTSPDLRDESAPSSRAATAMLGRAIRSASGGSTTHWQTIG